MEGLLEEVAPERGHEIGSEDEARADGMPGRGKEYFILEAASGVW